MRRMVSCIDSELACKLTFILENLDRFENCVFITGKRDASGRVLGGNLDPSFKLFELAKFCSILKGCTDGHH